MGRWLLFFNSLLLMSILYLSYKIFFFWKTPYEEVIPKISRTRSAKPKKIPFHSKVNKPLSSYDVILAKNLFRPDRRKPKKEEDRSKVSKKKRKEKIFLHGIISMGDYKVALLRDGLGKDINIQRQNRFRKGDRFEDYIVKDILEDRVILKSESGEKEILIHDPENPKVRARIEPRPQHQSPVAKLPPPQSPTSSPSTISSRSSAATNPFLAILQQAAKRAKGKVSQPSPTVQQQRGTNPFAEAIFGQRRK